MNGQRVYSLRIDALGSLALGDESGIGNFEQTSSHIPGSALRGALAATTLHACTQPEYLHNHRQCPDRETCPFWLLFADDNILFGDAYPGKVGPVYPFPLTARTCKYYPGLEAGSEDKILEERHGVFDILAERFIYELLTDLNFPARAELLPELKEELAKLHAPLTEHCPRCQAPLVKAEGTYSPGPPLLPAGEIFIRRQAHVGIDRARFVAEDGLLFTQEVVDTAGTLTSFFSRVRVSNAKASLLEQYLVGEHYLGRGRSRGLGQVIVGMYEDFPTLGIDERVHLFQKVVNTIFASWSEHDPRLPNQLPGLLISLTLRSPMILESLGRPHLIPTPEEIGLPQARLLRAWSKPRTITGWDSAAQMPRRTRPAAEVGSVYIYLLPTETLDFAALEALETQGLGQERVRGFGQVEICSPFHTLTLRVTGGNHE